MWPPKKKPNNGGTTTLLDIEQSEFGYNNEQMQPKNWSKSDKNNLNVLEKKWKELKKRTIKNKQNIHKK